MLIVGGGFSGGDSNVLQPFFTSGGETENGRSGNAIVVNPELLAWILEGKVVSCDTGCWQQECEAGMAIASQLCAIFSQHCRSSAVICQSVITHATAGRDENIRAIRMAANCETLHTVVILPQTHSDAGGQRVGADES